MPSRLSPEKSEIKAIRAALKKPIVLIGMMGSGKSRLGRRLADLLDLDFYDTDKLIEEKAGCTVSEIFEREGEAKFRESEKKIVIDLLRKGPCVIATGGGAPAIEGVMDMLSKKALTVWMRVEIPEILRRLKDSKDRPLLRKGDPEKTLRDLLKKREPVYARADVTFDGPTTTPKTALSGLIKALYAHLNPGNF